MKLLYRQGNYGSVCFPYKKSCEFATKKCLVQCSDRFCDMTMANSVFKAFKDKSTVELYSTIKKEMDKYTYSLLAWFDSGDCPKDLTEKVVEVINQFFKDGYSQIGFTRNKQLWEKVQNLRKKDKGKTKTRFILTVERGTKIIDEGFYAVPDYKKQRVSILYHHTFDRPKTESVDKIIANGEAHVRYCGGAYSYIERETVTEPKLLAQCDASNSNAGTVLRIRDDTVHETNCLYCLDNSRGCFEKD